MVGQAYSSRWAPAFLLYITYYNIYGVERACIQQPYSGMGGN